MKNLPIPLLTFLAVQVGGAVWFAAQLESRVYNLETEDYSSQLQMIKENAQGVIVCVEIYEPINIAEQYLPSAQVATTTASIAAVAGASALLAKPLADLLLRVFKPAIKQVLNKVNKILGKTPYKPTQSELRTNEYRVKKGLVGIPFAKDHAKRMKSEKKREKEQQKKIKEYNKKKK